MPRSRLILCALALPLLVGCADSAIPTAPPAHDPAPASSVTPPSADATVLIRMRDDCDPATFDAVLGPGSCVGDGHRTFQAFIAELTATKTVATWRNVPSVLSTPVGNTLEIRNRGGEVHTFTHVAAYGGGIVPLLNELSGTGRAVPECKTLLPTDFVPHGGLFTIPTGGSGPGAGTHLYMCCIHPWMRTTATLTPAS